MAEFSDAFPCHAGYVCLGGSSSPTPSDGSHGYLCPAGHSCPVGSASEMPCEPGTYSPAPGAARCIICPKGTMCSFSATQEPSICPAGHFCPSGTALPQPCPLGTFNNQNGAHSLSACTPCPSGVYCGSYGASVPQGSCLEGYFCQGGAMGPTPHYSDNFPRNGPCPVGHYCPAGCLTPVQCPLGSIRKTTGGASIESCSACPAGHYCSTEGLANPSGPCAAGFYCPFDFSSTTPYVFLCPKGHYCPEGSALALPCPTGEYQPNPGSNSCIPCRPGFYCEEAIVGEPWPCPPHSFCPAGTMVPQPCPNGTYTHSNQGGLQEERECLPCPSGKFCRYTGCIKPPVHACGLEGSRARVLQDIFVFLGVSIVLRAQRRLCCVLRILSEAPLEVRAYRTAYPAHNCTGVNLEIQSFICVPLVITVMVCLAVISVEGQDPDHVLCTPIVLPLEQAARATACPAVLVHTVTVQATVIIESCPFPYYCPANSSAMKSCEGGSMPVSSSGLRGSKNSCCSVCDGGTYRPYLSHIPQCLPCPPGYFCPPGTDNYKSNPCLFGYVCPMASNQPIPCPPGSFGNLTHAEKMGDCHPCPAGTFNHLPAQKACFPCGSSSTSPAGSSSCTCKGRNRAFQQSDGSCLCRTGFIFYNELDFKSSASDSELDCQPEVSRRCAAGQVRLAASRECVSPSLHCCNITCGPHGGTLDVEMGICRCERYVSAEELCNTSCLSRLPQLSAQLSPDGHLLLSLKERNSMVWARTVMDILGPDIHAKNFGNIHLVQFDSEGVFGWIPTQSGLISQFLSEPTQLLNTRARKKRDTEDDDGDLAVLPRIPNPIACLASGDMLIFHLTINHTDRHLSHFPVYQKDHLFNSNPSWDFGAFRHLQILMKQTNFNSTRFAHVFSETGKYVFVDSAVPEWSMVVVVSEEGTECDSRASVFQPMTPAQLVRYGIVKQHRLNLLPDWGVIAGILSLLLVVVVVLTTTVLVLRPSKTKLISQWRMKPKWRSLGEPFCPVGCVCNGDSIATPSIGGVLGSRGVGEGAEAEEPAVSKGGIGSGRCDLEEFNVKTLYDKLEDQNLHIASQLARHRKDTQEFYRNICQHTETLKDVFENMDHKKLSLLKELLVHNAMRDKPSYNNARERDTQAEASVALLQNVLRSVEALLCRLTGETWQNQDLTGLPYCHTGPHDARPTNMCYTQFSSMNMTKADALPHEPVHLQSTALCLSDHDLSKMVSMSPLFKTLQEIQQSLQSLTTVAPSQHLHNAATEHSVQENHDGQLIPTALDNLSPQHSAVFLFGCQVMQLLENCPLFPSVLLLVAKSIPVSSSSSNEVMLAHCSGDFYFDATNQILYLSEAKLQHVGHFIAIILQSMAHIASGSKPQSFMQALHEAISALSLQLFNFSFKWSTAESELNASERQHGALAKEFLNIRVPTEAHFTEHLLASRLKKYKYFKLEQLISNLKQSPAEGTDTGLPPKGTPMQRSCIEEKIDCLNESFLQLSVQLQKRAQMSTWQKERESSAGNHSARATPTSMPSLSRNGTILLELKRRYVSQRLNELQITLGQLTQCQQHDSESKHRTRGRAQTDSSTTQQEQREYYPGVDGCSPPHGQRQDSIPASQSHSQQTVENRVLGNYKLESHISDQQRSGSVQCNNPETLLDCQILESHGRLQLNVPGKQELNSQITIENTSGHTDIDDM
ncbi:uncharacterized protein LOC111665041 [Seriola lalandi dorsalis]|uniref:uncharacterized protein LOC111665041 n=1 Tax=Seriola lalandi dorsalis TaxID=1841481 RepID=UPI000C6F7C57|nr:uncharacterized protein LOC111665041 [Seriola lalandi dorsalis]